MLYYMYLFRSVLYGHGTYRQIFGKIIQLTFSGEVLYL